MYRLLLAFFLSCCFLNQGFAQNSDYYNYIEKYKKIAVREMERAGIPASIKLAQALLESNAGKSELARRAHNHFGIKCHSGWKGRTYHKKDDDYDEFGDLKKSCFRRYRRAEDSYIAHSEFLRDPKKANRYGFLFYFRTDDYRRWARGLKMAGYATSGNYDDKLISIIETYKLYKYDHMSLDKFKDELSIRPNDAIAGLDIRRINDVKVVFAKGNLTPQNISILTGVSMKHLRKYNEALPAPGDTLAAGYRIFLQPKRCSYRGKRKWHYVREGETMHDISQLYGVKLSKLYSRNRMVKGTEPQQNERIKLKGWKVRKGERPRLVTEPAPSATTPVLIDENEDFMDEDVTPEQPADTQPATNTGDDNTTAPAGAVYHTVIKGDTLYGLSKRYGTTVEAIQRLNNLTGTTISIGQVLRVK
ncbi:MAG: glucosaminidase domain-containing protein [Saprospiraceae bacterium]